MIRLLRPCSVLVDKGQPFQQQPSPHPWWEREDFPAGTELDEFDMLVNVSDFEEGEDFERLNR
jgi:hypothetical protein